MAVDNRQKPVEDRLQYLEAWNAELLLEQQHCWEEDCHQ
jgi:hypothetical protein